MKRVIIAGGPRTGKSTLSRALAQVLGTPDRIYHTDDLVGVLEWSDASAEVARWLDEKESWQPQICEGVAMARAVRKWALDRPETEKPCLVFVHLSHTFEALTVNQARMAKGCRTVFAEILPDLRLRGVHISDYQDTGPWHALSRAEALASVLEQLSTHTVDT